MQLSLRAQDLPAYFAQTLSSLLTNNRKKPLAIALSGGADSRALAMLARNTHPIHALIVDHGLREHSRQEAEQTLTWAQQLGIPAQLICLTLTGMQSGIQQRAREARYEALVAACHKLGASHLLLGQHADDQVETTLFRLLRGSGLHGLAGMSMQREQQGITLLRPMLAIPKRTLTEYLTQQQQSWINDASNENEDFTRVRLRKWLAFHATAQQRARLWQFAEHCGVLRAQDERFLNERLEQLATLDASGTAFISPELLTQPPHIAIWMLRRLLICIHGSIAMPRHKEVEQLYTDLRTHPERPRSLHHCLIFAHQNQLIICREPARCAPPLAASAEQNFRWDHRFDITLNTSLPADFHLAALGEAGYRALKNTISLPRRAALSIPCLWHLDEPVCAPHINHYVSPSWKDAFTAHFAPAKRLAQAPFFLMN